MVCFAAWAVVAVEGNDGRQWVESGCGAVAVGRACLFPPLSSGGALVARPWLRFHIHRVTGGGRPPPVPTERGVRFSRTTLFGSWFTALQEPAAPGKGGAALVSATVSVL